MLKKYPAYIKDNPKGYWFKAKMYGWGWTPVKWQGWLVVAVSIVIVAIGMQIGEADDAPGVVLISILLAIAIIFTFGYWKGEKPGWRWGSPKK